MATIVKNFRIKSGLVVEGSTATINGQSVLTETGSDQYILDLVGGETLITSVSNAFSVASGELSLNYSEIDTRYDAANSASQAQSAAQGYADGVAGQAYSNAQSYADGVSYQAQSAAESYTDTAIGNIPASLDSRYDSAGSASTAQTNANTYTNTALNDYTPTLSLDTTVGGYGYLKSADLSSYATETYVGTAIDNLVDGAPGLLDTLNEIAAAINDDANYSTTITTALSGKQGSLTASTGITIDGSNNISVTSNTYDAYGAASQAQSAAQGYADGVAGQAQSAAEGYADGVASQAQSAAQGYADGVAGQAQSAAESYATGLVDDLKDATTAFTAINLNSVVKERAVTSTIATAGTANAISWPSSEYKTAKLLVKFKTATHTQVSEVLLTLDSSNNIAITEYAEVGTNGSLGTITASYEGIPTGTVIVSVTTANDNTDVMLKATLIV